MTPDIFTQMVNGIWFGLASYGPLRARVKVANRIQFNRADEIAIKPSLTSGDFPQLVVVPAAGSGVVNAQGTGSSSHSESFGIDYVLGLMTDERSTSIDLRSIDPLQWACLRALQRFSPRLPGCPWVVVTGFGPFGPQIAEIPGIEQVAKGWKSVMRFRVTAVLGKGRMY